MKKLTGFIVKLLPLGLLLGLCIALSGCGKMQRINLNDLMSYEITGYSGQGKLTWDLDDQKFAEQLLSGRTEAEAWSMLYRAGSSVNGTWSKEEGLSNGDVITFRWTYNPDVLKKDYKVILEAEDMTVTVQGLPEVVKTDVFSGLEINVSGYSGKGKLEMDVSGCEIREIVYEASQKENLKNGDVVTLTASYRSGCSEDQIAGKYGKVPEKMQTEYTVSGLTELKETDPFENVTLSFGGTEKRGTVTVQGGSCPIDGIRYVADNDGSLDNGDTVTVHVCFGSMIPNDEATRRAFEEKGYTPTALQKDYIAENIPKWVSRADEITEEAKAAIDRSADDLMKAYSNREMMGYPAKGAYQRMERAAYYVISRKDYADNWLDENNRVIAVYHVYLDDGEASGEYYYPMIYNDVLVLPDGSLDLDSENYDYYIGNFDTIDTLPEQLFGWDMGYGYRYPDNAFTSLVLSRTDEYKHDEMVLE